MLMTILFSLGVLLRDSLTTLIVFSGFDQKYIYIYIYFIFFWAGQYLGQMLPLPHNNPPLIKPGGLIQSQNVLRWGLNKG